MKNIPKSILILLVVSFIIRFSIGIISGAADDDAADYVTYAIQTAHDNDLRNLLDFNLGRQVIQLWLFCLVCFMKLLGATNSVAILLTSIIGTLNILIFFKIIRLYYPEKKSLYISIIYSVVPIIIYTGYNPCYETIFIFLFLLSVYYFFIYLNSPENKYLILSGLAGSLLAFIHAYGYPVILIILLSFPFIYSGKDRIRKWILFSFFLLFLPLIQMIVWKITYNSFYPYIGLLTHWVSNTWSSITAEVTRFVVYSLFSLSFILIFGLFMFIIDLKGNFNRVFGLLLILALIALFFLFSFRSQNDLFKYFFLIFSLFFLILKRPLIKENALIYLFGVFGLVFFTVLISLFPSRGNPRMFAFIITVLVPVTWFYLEKLFKNSYLVFSVFVSTLGFLLIAGLILNFTSYRNKEIGFVKGKYSSAFLYNIPFSLQNQNERIIVKWLKQDGVKPDNYILASLKSNRYVPANLDMAQNHFLSSCFFSYSHKEGFTKQSLESYLDWINKYKPQYIIWDIDFQDDEYSTIINKETGERKIAFSFNEFNSRVSENYQIADTITGRIVVYKSN
jgi:hypothetical protein